MRYKDQVNRLSLETIRKVLFKLIDYRTKMYVYDYRVDNKINELQSSYLLAFNIIKQ